MQETTQIEKMRLFQSEEYKAALERKGLGQAAWNWQTRERMQEKIQHFLNNTQEVVPQLTKSLSATQLRDQPSIGINGGPKKLSGHEMLD